jgi:pheromone shutdown protein TraB
VSPGAEMKTALELARKEDLKVAYIDQPIKITLRNFSNEFTWKEKFRFLGDIFRGIFFPKRQMKLSGMEKLDLRKVPEQELITLLIKQLRERYPSLYKTLIDDRNKYMVKQLIKLLREDPKKRILVVVGAGHKEGMNELLLKVEVV